MSQADLVAHARLQASHLDEQMSGQVAGGRLLAGFLQIGQAVVKDLGTIRPAVSTRCLHGRPYARPPRGVRGVPCCGAFGRDHGGCGSIQPKHGRQRRRPVRRQAIPGVHGGSPDGLDVAFSRAAGASRHGELIKLAKRRVGLRRLPYWPMRCIALGMLVALVEPFAEAAQAALRLHRMAHTRRHRSLRTLGVERVIRLWIEERQQSLSAALLKPVVPDLHFVHQPGGPASWACERGALGVGLKACILGQ